MNTDISNRIKLLIDYLNLNKSSFSKAIGLSNNVTIGRIINENRKPSYDVIEKILLTFGNINANWLITGKGSMLKDKSGLGYYIPPDKDPPEQDTNIKLLLEAKEKEIERLMGIIEMMIREDDGSQIQRSEHKTG